MLKQGLNKIPRPWLIRLSLWLRPFIDVYYRGKQYTDPINGKSYRKFLPYGHEKQRPNALSPGTFSLERHRLMWLYLKTKTNFFTAPNKVLHIAPEQAFYHRFKKIPNLQYTTTDLESPIVDVKADICNLPFQDNSFDIVFCNHVLEHITDDTKALQEIYRILKPKAWAILQVPIQYQRQKTYEDHTITTPQERAKHFGQYDHVRIYGLDYYEKLEKIGFILNKINLSQEISAEKIKQYGLEKNEILPIVTKP